MQNDAPNCEASVSPDLIRLMRGLALPDPDSFEPDVKEQVPAQTDDVGPAPEAHDSMPHETIRLRVDGARPVAFRGVRLFGTILHHFVQDEAGFTAAIHSHLSLFRTEDGRIVAHIAAEPGAGLSALPTYRTADIWAPTDLAAFVQNATGDVCFGTTPPGHHRPGLKLSGPSAEECGIRMPHRSHTKQEIAQ